MYQSLDDKRDEMLTAKDQFDELCVLGDKLHTQLRDVRRKQGEAEMLYKKAVYEFMDAAGIPTSFQNRERFELLEELGTK